MEQKFRAASQGANKAGFGVYSGAWPGLALKKPPSRLEAQHFFARVPGSLLPECKVSSHIFPGTLHLGRQMVSTRRCDLLDALSFSRAVHGRSSMYPSLNARFVRPLEQVVCISEVAENLFSRS